MDLVRRAPLILARGARVQPVLRGKWLHRLQPSPLPTIRGLKLPPTVDEVRLPKYTTLSVSLFLYLPLKSGSQNTRLSLSVSLFL